MDLIFQSILPVNYYNPSLLNYLKMCAVCINVLYLENMSLLQPRIYSSLSSSPSPLPNVSHQSCFTFSSMCPGHNCLCFAHPSQGLILIFSACILAGSPKTAGALTLIKLRGKFGKCPANGILKNGITYFFCF